MRILEDNNIVSWNLGAIPLFTVKRHDLTLFNFSYVDTAYHIIKPVLFSTFIIWTLYLVDKVYHMIRPAESILYLGQ